MSEWEVGVVAGVAAAIVLSFIRSQFKGRAGIGISMSLAVTILCAGIALNPQRANAFTQQQDHAAQHVYSTQNLNCTWVDVFETMDNTGNPRIATTTSIDWGPQCHWITYTAAADRLAVREDLESFNGYAYYSCETGPWVQPSGTNSVHSVSTGWSFYTPCGDPGWYELIGYGSFLTGAGWQGGSLGDAWEYQTP